MTEREFFLKTLKAFSAVREGGLEGQVEALGHVIKELQGREVELRNDLRVLNAQKTWDQRIQQHEAGWASHMSHCYGLDHDTYPDEPPQRFWCKYGQDDVCPAALYKEPYEEYLRVNKIKTG